MRLLPFICFLRTDTVSLNYYAVTNWLIFFCSLSFWLLILSSRASSWSAEARVWQKRTIYWILSMMYSLGCESLPAELLKADILMICDYFFILKTANSVLNVSISFSNRFWSLNFLPIYSITLSISPCTELNLREVMPISLTADSYNLYNLSLS